ncbi:uncharacterized protein Z519_09610 [Cladophialophora bantiana CBS 173.52]|uniref:Uncharacterized protein n=1 Tax=Cladophialophora bantiana (strain ATCC 10958 / CBS 173.52 / CDC B-1940 / NIH 8579) TaxID=1442370 RepID=A0A0D2HY32_CLAB1|nr:uncharacterized protein Z519_09610 [Cladophialophora bantiana CBS 173.52]KIW89454.1 hypothetical protein Z519_09610 [Cladophialophora bantiana CBS 173.52]
MNNIQIEIESEDRAVTQYGWNAWGEYLQDITSPDFFDINYRYISNTVVDAESETWAGSGVDVYSRADGETVSGLASSETSPNIWVAADNLAKRSHSTIMTDLGQTGTTTTATTSDRGGVPPNLLTNATALQYFSKNITYMQGFIVNAIPGPANDSYEALKEETRPLGTSPAVISTKYLCQVPKRKSLGALIISILVAELVFLQALWKVFTLGAEAWLTNKDPRGMLKVHIEIPLPPSLPVSPDAREVFERASE